MGEKAIISQATFTLRGEQHGYKWEFDNLEEARKNQYIFGGTIVEVKAELSE